MEFFKQLHDIFMQNKLLYICVSAIISAFVSVIAYIVQRKIEKKQKNTTVIVLVVFLCSFCIQFVPMYISTYFPLPVKNEPESDINNNDIKIPDNVVMSPLKLTLREYLGEYYYNGVNIKNEISGLMDKIDATIDVYNEDYDVHYSEYEITTNERNEIVYLFNYIPAGNYIITVTADGYQTQKDTILFDALHLQKIMDDIPYWSMHMVMSSLNTSPIVPMNIRFFDVNQKPMSGIDYEINSRPLRKDYIHSYPNKTNEYGECIEKIFILPNSEFEIAFVNPYTGNECIYNITAELDENVKWCDNILIVDDTGIVNQTIPSILWNY